LRLVAEGIQTPGQHEIVRDLGCHSAQGFYFGRPAGEALRALPLVSANRETLRRPVRREDRADQVLARHRAPAA
jgi:EAL domain-containing protein (putative c-di-GMP-specific phosphodiesterase class I)